MCLATPAAALETRLLRFIRYSGGGNAVLDAELEAGLAAEVADDAARENLGTGLLTRLGPPLRS